MSIFYGFDELADFSSTHDGLTGFFFLQTIIKLKIGLCIIIIYLFQIYGKQVLLQYDNV